VTAGSDLPREPPANVLLVDDLPANLLALEATLADLGQNLVKAHSGEEALRHLLAADFAVVLLDVRMPGLDGFEAARLIRGRKRSRHTPIIFLTAEESPEFPVAEAYKLGAVDYLVKPLVPEVLRAKVAGFVELYQKTEQVRRQAEQLRHLERQEAERRLAEEALRRSEAHFRLMADSAPVLLWVADPDGRRTFFNRPWLELTGRTPEQERGEGWAEGVHPDDLPALLETYRAALQDRQPFRTEHRLRRADGAYRWVLDGGVPRFDPAGNFAGFIGSAVDITDRREAEEQIRRSQRDLADFVENATVGLHWVGPDGTILWANRAELEMLGYPAEEYVGRNIAEFHADRPATEEILGRLRAGEELNNYEARMRCKDGSLRHVLITSSARREGGELVHSRCFTRDITDRVRAEQALRAKLEEWRVTLASIGDAVLVTDARARVAFLNPVAEALTGWGQEAVGRDLGEVFRIVHEETRQPVESPVARVLREGLVVGLANHTMLLGRDGTERPIADSGAPIRDAQGNVHGVVLVFRDVTEARAADRALRESEARFRGIVETANEGIWILDEHARITLANPRMGEILGRTPEGLVGRQKWDFLFEEDRPAMRALFERRRAGVSEEADVRFRHRDGREVWTLMAARPLFSAEGEFRGALDLFTDITERKALEEERRRRAEELAEEGRRKDELLAMLAHELRNPLAPLLTTVQVLRQAGGDPAIRAESVERLDRQVRHLRRLVDDLLDVSRLAGGQPALRLDRLDLARLARTTAEDARPLLQQAGLGLTVQTPQTPVWVRGDSTRLIQALSNLLDNAAKFTGLGGEVTVRVGEDPPREQAVLAVADTGRGIDPTVLPRLFEPFVQASQGLDRSQGGLGLGLAVVKRVVELHGGTVAARSAGAGRGAEFEARLPLEPEPAALAGVGEPSPRGASGSRILVIEDNRDGAESLRMLLSLLGHEVRVAFSGPEGVHAATGWRPEVVISDIGLPGFDGYEVARRLRRTPGLEGALLIALTGYGSEEDLGLSRAAGFDHHLVKPAEPDVLQQVLASRAG
jgi:PAS domain S-box-containing protein